MAKFKTHNELLTTISSIHSSKYKTARALKFIYKHRKAHRKLIIKINNMNKLKLLKNKNKLPKVRYCRPLTRS